RPLQHAPAASRPRLTPARNQQPLSGRAIPRSHAASPTGPPRRTDPRIHGRCMTAQVLAPHRRTARPACATTSLTHLYAPRRGAPESPVHAGRLTPRRIRAGVPMGLHGKIAIDTGASAGVGGAYAR